MFPEPRVWAAQELRPGLRAEFERDLGEADVLAFARTSGDANPLHVDVEYAGGSNFQGRIVHGAYQVGLASALLGMHLPGRNVLLGSVNARFPPPLYFPCRVVVRRRRGGPLWGRGPPRRPAARAGPRAAPPPPPRGGSHGLHAPRGPAAAPAAVPRRGPAGTAAGQPGGPRDRRLGGHRGGPGPR